MRKISGGQRFLIRLVLALAFIVLGFHVRAEPDEGFRVSGQVSATDSEVDEGFFGVGQETVVIAKPGTGAHKWLKEHAGQRITVTLAVDAGTH